MNSQVHHQSHFMMPRNQNNPTTMASNQQSPHMTAGFDSNSNKWSSLNTNGIHDEYQSFNKTTQKPIQQSFGTLPQVPLQSSQEKVEHIFNKKYFEGVIFNKQNELLSISFNMQYIKNGDENNFQSNGIGHQDFASNNEDELISSIAHSPPQQNQDNQSSIIFNSNQKPPVLKIATPGDSNLVSTELDRQISDIISVIGRLNKPSCFGNTCNGSQTNQSEDITPSITQNMQPADQPSYKLSKVTSAKRFASRNNLGLSSKSPLQKFLTSTHSSSTLTLTPKPPTERPKPSLLYSKMKMKSPTGTRPNLNQSPRYNKSPTLQQKFDSHVALLTSSASQGRLNANMPGMKGQQTLLSEDMISRLFINQMRQREVKEQMVQTQRQKEVEQIKDKPSISPKSRDIALSSSRFSLPLFSPIRYKKEIMTYQSRKEEAKRLKYLNDRDKEEAEDREMQAFFKSPSNQKLNRKDFLRKYNNQVLQWENRVKSGNSRTRMMYPHSDDSEPQVAETNLFKPKINLRSKELVKDMDNLLNRVKKLQEDKQKKILEITQKIQPSFRPQINPRSTQIALESRKAINRQDQTQMVNNYLQRIDEISQNFTNNFIQTQPKNQLKSSISQKMLQTQKPVIFKSYSPVNLSKLTKKTSSSYITEKLQQQRVLGSSKSASTLTANTHLPTPHFQVVEHSFEDDVVIQESIEQPVVNIIQQQQPTAQEEIETVQSVQLQQFDSKESTQQDENLQLYIQNYLFHTNLSQESKAFQKPSNEVQQNYEQEAQTQSQDINILQEYLKLKKEFDEQLSSRTQSQVILPQNSNRYNMLEHPYAFDSATSQEEEKQVVRESVTTFKVEGQHDSFVKDSAIKVEQSYAQTEQRQVVEGYNDGTSDKRRSHSKKGSNLSQYLTGSQQNSQSPNKANYKSVDPQPHTTNNDSPDAHLPLRNILLTHSIQPRSITGMLSQQETFKTQVPLGAANGNLFSQQLHTKKSSGIEEVEELIQNIRTGINEIEGGGNGDVFQTFQVKEQDKESSSSSDFIDYAGLDKISSKEGGSNSLQEDTNSEEQNKTWKLALNDYTGKHLKKSSDYMKIVENQKNKNLIKKNQEPQQQRHKKSPTQQISTNEPKKIILSRSSNMSGSGNQNPEVTKHEISGAQTYYSGAFRPVNEQYSLNTWNSPSKNNKQICESQFKAYLLSQLSDQKMSEIAMYVDPETRQMIENSRLTLLQTVEKEDLKQYYAAANHLQKFNESSQKQEEIVQKLIFSNNKQKDLSQHEVDAQQIMRPLSIPREVYMEIEEYGLDTLSIIKQVISQFPGLLDQCSKKEGSGKIMKSKVRKQQKSAETLYKQYQTSMFVTFNKSKP